MKKLSFIISLCAVVALTFGACSKSSSSSESPSPIIGEWHMTSWEGGNNAVVTLYAAFTATNTFELYQQYNESYFIKFTGSYSAKGGVFSGVYSDGEPFADTYTVKVSADNNELTLTSQSNDKRWTKFVREAVPQSVKEAVVETRASADESEAVVPFF